MPSNIQTLNELSSVKITNKTIETIPSYLRKFKEDNSKEIASWINNSKSASITEMIIAMGSGISYKSNGTNQLFESYSSFILGKTGYQNRWQLNYVKDSSIRDDDFILSYFDGVNHFKRFSVEASTGTIKSRSADFRNGNIPNCNADYQIAFGYSDTAPFNDYSLYRHNFRSTHTVDTSLNVENSLDLYIWDANNDKPESIGSRHVVRWDALGNEEIVSGLRIDGGVTLDISTDSLKIAEKVKFAISKKGVIYYNKTTDKYRYSENGSLFKDLGSGSGGSGSTIETCKVSDCARINEPLDIDNSLAVLLYNENEIVVDSVSIIADNDVSDNTRLDISLMVSSFVGSELFPPNAGPTWTMRETTSTYGHAIIKSKAYVQMIKADMVRKITIPANCWYMVIITYNERMSALNSDNTIITTNDRNKSTYLYGKIEMAHSISTGQLPRSTNFTFTNSYSDISVNGTIVSLQTSPMSYAGGTSAIWLYSPNTYGRSASTFVPYIKIGTK